MLWHKTPALAQSLFPKLVWRKETERKSIFLTFDDGPIPEATPWVLDTLKSYNAKATFFCVGHNVEKHPGIFQRLVKEGHSVGNHTYHHLNGWKTGSTTYLKDYLQCESLFHEHGVKTSLFRPPYGRITLKQSKYLKAKQIIMWDVLSGDFSKKTDPEVMLQKCILYSQPGSIVVFHDSVKAFKNLEFILPEYLNHFAQQGYQFLKL